MVKDEFPFKFLCLCDQSRTHINCSGKVAVIHKVKPSLQN